MNQKCGFLVVVVLVLVVQSPAQYYEPREYGPAEAWYVTAGVVNREFTPLGSNSLPDSLAIRYHRLMPMVSFRQGTTEFYLGYTTFDLAGSSKSTVLFGGRFAVEIPIVGRKPGALLFPLEIGADFTRAEGIGTSREDFNIASVGIGGGLKYRYFTSDVEFSLGVVEFAQFASEGIGVGNGFSAATAGDAILLLRNVGILDGIAVGYRFRLQTWSISESKFNYRSISHGPYIGIMF